MSQSKFKTVDDYLDEWPLHLNNPDYWKKSNESFLRYGNLEPQYFKLMKELPDLINSDAILGIEIEVENITDSSSIPQTWCPVIDNSLRNSGMEFISVPLQTQVVKSSLIALYLALINYQINRVEFSWRTGLHEHFNLRHFRKENVFTFILVYILFEDLLFEFAGESRRRANFCVPISETQLTHHIRNLIYDVIPFESLSRSWDKYSALNLRNLVGLSEEEDPEGKTKKGTAEFRHFGGTADLNQILNWTNILLRIYEYSKRTPLDIFVEKFNYMKSFHDFNQFKQEVFKEHSQILKPSKEWRNSYLSTIPIVKMCLAAPSQYKIEYKKSLGLAKMVEKKLKTSKKLKELDCTIKLKNLESIIFESEGDN